MSIIEGRESLNPPMMTAFEFDILRHGEQVRYESKVAGLSTFGQEQMKNLANVLCSQIQEEERWHMDQTHILFLSSTRPRTRQSIREIHDELYSSQRNGDLRRVKLYKPHDFEPLQTADSLGKLIENKHNPIPPTEAFSKWQTLSAEEFDYYKSESPQSIGKRMLTMIDVCKQMAQHRKDRGNQYRTRIIASTHETTLYAIRKMFNPNFSGTISHGELVRIFIGLGDEPTTVKFRDEEYLYFPNEDALIKDIYFAGFDTPSPDNH